MQWTFLQSFSFIPHMASEELIFWMFFANLAFLLPGQQMKLRGLVKKYTFGRRPLNKHFKKKKKKKKKNFHQNICCEIAINANFNFPIISQWKFKAAIATKELKQRQQNNSFIEANIVNNSEFSALSPL